MVFDVRSKLMHAEGSFRSMLFDLATDPEEFHDLGNWSCPAYVPVSELIYAAFRSNAKGLLPPSDEWRRRGL